VNDVQRINAVDEVVFGEQWFVVYEKQAPVQLTPGHLRSPYINSSSDNPPRK
jgi:hypothetical protein